MLETTLFLSALSAIAAIGFFTSDCSKRLFSKTSDQTSCNSASRSSMKAKNAVNSENFPLKMPEESTLRRHYLTHLRSEIESTLFPRPTDSILQRHYDALVSAELEIRLAALAE